MALIKPSLAAASAGTPITAQAWNAVLNAIGALYDAVLALGGNTVEVNLRDGATAVLDASVVAVPASGAPIAAVPPRGGGTSFTLAGLSEGTWTVHVTARGYAAPAAAPTVTVPASGPLSINLTSNTRAMTDVLGLTASDALTRLNTDGIQVLSIFDVHGEAVAVSPLPANRSSARVLFQFPDPGDRVVAASARTRLVLSAVEQQETTTVPSLIGLTYEQLLQALAANGLRLGRVTYQTGE